MMDGWTWNVQRIRSVIVLQVNQKLAMRIENEFARTTYNEIIAIEKRAEIVSLDMSGYSRSGIGM